MGIIWILDGIWVKESSIFVVNVVPVQLNLNAYHKIFNTVIGVMSIH